MFIKSANTHFIRPVMAVALAVAAFEKQSSIQHGGKLAGKVADSFIKARPVSRPDWTVNVHTRKNVQQVQGLMA